MVLHKKGEELYSTMETAMTSGVQSLCRPLDAAPADGTLFLQELLAKWNRHIKAVNFTRDILMYMDRTYTPTNHKTPIKELGLRLWRDHIARSDKIRERLIEAVKRQGGSEDDELVAGVNKMLAELGEGVPGLFFPDGELHVTGP
ncbi:Cullin-3B [Dichanthelium oligosanthes]|uniref:Cullin-3B n=1 Tax=Dichanthelium oligosanthes TaxID=888268 RepID=A0A1E5V198_9POAL|nr:Cullin-3B [Dichanthelium oligosanthes]